MPRKLIYQRTRGSMGEDEQWWYLDETDGEAPTVTHEWSVTTLETLKTDSGKKTFTLDEARAAAPPEVLRAIVERFG